MRGRPSRSVWVVKVEESRLGGWGLPTSRVKIRSVSRQAGPAARRSWVWWVRQRRSTVTVAGSRARERRAEVVLPSRCSTRCPRTSVMVLATRSRARSSSTSDQAAAKPPASLRATYRAIEADAIPYIRMGRRISIPTAKVLDQLARPAPRQHHLGRRLTIEARPRRRTVVRAVSRRPPRMGSVLYSIPVEVRLAVVAALVRPCPFPYAYRSE